MCRICICGICTRSICVRGICMCGVCTCCMRICRVCVCRICVRGTCMCGMCMCVCVCVACVCVAGVSVDTHTYIIQRGGGLGSSTIFKNLMSPTPRRKWYLTTGRRAHSMVLDPIPQPLPVHFFGSRPQPPTSHRNALHTYRIVYYIIVCSDKSVN